MNGRPTREKGGHAKRTRGRWGLGWYRLSPGTCRARVVSVRDSGSIESSTVLVEPKTESVRKPVLQGEPNGGGSAD